MLRRALLALTEGVALSLAAPLRQGRAATIGCPALDCPSPSNYCEIWTFTFCSGMRRQLPLGRTLERFGNAWSTTQESIAAALIPTTVQAAPARTPWFVPAETVSMQPPAVAFSSMSAL